MRIAIPVWGSQVSPVLDTASRLLVIETQHARETSRFEALLEERDLTRKCARIQRLGVDVLICGAVSRSFSDMLTGLGIQMIAGRSGSFKAILNAYLEDGLTEAKFLMPGYKE